MTDVIDRCFSRHIQPHPRHRLGHLAEESIRRHEIGYPHARPGLASTCCPIRASISGARTARSTPGIRTRSPTCSRRPAEATSRPTTRFSKLINETTTRECHLRGLLRFKPATPVPLEEVEEAPLIVQAVLHGRDELRLDLGRSPRDAGRRHESTGRQEQHRRRRRGLRPLPADVQWRLQAVGDQAGRVGTLRRHELVPHERRRAANQDRPGRQARRRGRIARRQGGQGHRGGAALDARRRPDQPAATSRYLLDRRPRPAHLRPEERQSLGADQRETGVGGGRGHDCRRCRQGACRQYPDLRRQRRDRRFAAHEHQARGHCRGNWESRRRTRRSCSTICGAASGCRRTAS